MTAIELGAMAVKELMARTTLDQRDIEQLVFGMTVMIPEAPFIAREIALALGMNTVDAHSITRACATSFQTAASVADNIVAGYSDIAIAGGTDSTSSARVPLSSELSAVLRDVSFAKSMTDRIKLLSQLKAKDLLPQAPSITEYSVGETMGESTEKMVKKWGISRQEQARPGPWVPQPRRPRLGRRPSGQAGDDRLPASQGHPAKGRQPGAQAFRARWLQPVEARVRQGVRSRPRRQQQPAHRWCWRPADDERAQSQGAGLRATGL